MKLEDLTTGQIAKKGKEAVDLRNENEKKKDKFDKDLDRNSEIQRNSGGYKSSMSEGGERYTRQQVRIAENIIENSNNTIAEMQKHITGEKGGVLMGEAATEHEARLKKEIIDSYEKGDTKLGDSLTEEQARTSTAYSVAKEDYKQDLANPSFGKILNGLKEKIQKLLGRKK